jgi:hypothetical protein
MDIAKYSAVLWDIPKNTVDLDEKIIIKRALSFGGIFLIKDLINSLGLAPVRSVFDSMKPTEISPRKYNFFKHFFLI